MFSSFKKHFQLVVFRKLLEWKLEKSYTKNYTCHLDLHQRSLWNTSGKENWCSEHAQRAEAGQLSGSFQSNQPTLNPIRERSGRLDITHDVIGVQDERKTSHSQEIDVNSFCEEPDSSERTRRLVSVTNIENVPVSSQTRSVHESETFNVGDETLRERTERTVADHDVRWTRRTWTSEFQDYHIPLWSTRRVLAFDNWFRKLRTTRTDMLFNKIYDKINHLILSVQNQNKWFRMWAASNYVNLSYWNTGMVYCTCGHFLQKESAVNRKFINYTMDFSFSPWVCHQEGKTSWTSTW